MMNRRDRIGGALTVAAGLFSIAAALSAFLLAAWGGTRDDSESMGEICSWREAPSVPVRAVEALPQTARPRVVALVDGRVGAGFDTVQVHQGDVVDLRFVSDRPIVLRLHGYEAESRSSPEQPGAMVFKADLPGRFPIHEHRAGAGNHRTVLYVEVRP